MPLILAEATQAPSHGLDPGTWIGLVIATCATAYIYARARRKTKRDPLEQHPVSSGLAQQRAVERQMSNLLIELSEMARTISASLDTRAAKLEALLDEADQRIQILRALDSTSGSDTQPLQPASVASLPKSEVVADPPLVRVIPADERHTRVYELSDRGQSVHEIAEALGRPNGEIELILALRSREVVARAS